MGSGGVSKFNHDFLSVSPIISIMLLPPYII
jgi:hypothetical protein